MTLLREIQNNFQRYLQQDSLNIENYIAGPEANFIKKRLFIYKDAYYIRLTDTLKQGYPGVFALLGNDDFVEMAALYIEQNPSRHFSINHFGEKIIEFLANAQPYAKRLELAEMAKFEFALDTAIHTLDAPVLSPDDLTQVPQEKWPTIKLKPHPSVQLLTLEWNIPEIWQPAFEKKPLPELKKEGPSTWLVWQKNISTYYLRLSPHERFIMESLKKNLCIAEICEGLCEWLDEEEVPQRLVKTLLDWLHDKLLSQLDLA